jgi:hypothetical protein
MTSLPDEESGDEDDTSRDGGPSSRTRIFGSAQKQVYSSARDIASALGCMTPVDADRRDRGTATDRVRRQMADPARRRSANLLDALAGRQREREAKGAHQVSP